MNGLQEKQQSGYAQNANQLIGIQKEKKCFKCGKIKNLSEFYKHKKMLDGFLNKCKECAKKDVSENYFKNNEHYKIYDEKRSQLPHRILLRDRYSKTDAFKESHKKAVKRDSTKNKHKYSARTFLRNSVRDGKISKKPCIFCGSTAIIHGHHNDYSKPLEVVWLCPAHHSWAHSLVRTRILQNKSFPF